MTSYGIRKKGTINKFSHSGNSFVTSTTIKSIWEGTYGKPDIIDYSSFFN